MYCIYSNSEINKKDATLQHIIPLSMGGVNSFSIYIDRKINSTLGSKVEGTLINEFTMKIKQMHYEITGQSNSTPQMKMQGSIDGKPISIKWGKNKIDLFDPIKKEHLQGKQAVTLRTQIDLFSRLRFAAKVALEAGFFLFGKRFVEHADCDTLRKATFCEDFEKEQLDLLFYDNLHPIEEKDKSMHGIIKLLIEQMGSSSVVFGFAEGRLIVHIGIMGEWLSTINFSAQTEHFPIMEDSFRLGRVILCKEELYQDSLYNAIYELNKYLNIVKIDEPI